MNRRELLRLIGASPLLTGGLAGATDFSTSCDVLVVGSGAAGLSAALSAREAGMDVLLIEKNAFIGGDTLHSGGYFNAAGSYIQSLNGVTDSPDIFFDDMESLAEGKGSSELRQIMAYRAVDSLEWLEAHGVVFQKTIYQIYGSLRRRCHKPRMPLGSGYIMALSESCLDKEIRIQTNCALKSLYNDAHRISAVVELEKKRLYITPRKGIVLAAGGFGGNNEMVSGYVPEYKGFLSDSGGTGEVIRIASAYGATTANMDSIECIPEGSNDPNLSARIYAILLGIAFVNQDGRRFVDEAAPRNRISEAIIEQRPRKCFTIVDDRNIKLQDKNQHKNLYRSYYAGNAWQADSIENLCRQINVPYEALLESISDLPYERRPSKPPFWAVGMYPWIHYTLGGLVINEFAQCLDAKGNPVDGLFAAGQVTGNVHGKSRIGGNGLTDAVVFGRIAGNAAASS